MPLTPEERDARDEIIRSVVSDETLPIPAPQQRALVDDVLTAARQALPTPKRQTYEHAALLLRLSNRLANRAATMVNDIEA